MSELQEAAKLLSDFTYKFCRDKSSKDLVFNCKACPFKTEDNHCLVKLWKTLYAPEYKNFGPMADR